MPLNLSVSSQQHGPSRGSKDIPELPDNIPPIKARPNVGKRGFLHKPKEVKTHLYGQIKNTELLGDQEDDESDMEEENNQVGGERRDNWRYEDEQDEKEMSRIKRRRMKYRDKGKTMITLKGMKRRKTKRRGRRMNTSTRVNAGLEGKNHNEKEHPLVCHRNHLTDDEMGAEGKDIS
ncbi:hypothetical protein BGX38DRAFT_1275132 [Terfezia claveryi]|nr:hypothetical protein BGX38DRAFT_1275132 [Terfezia claveryi]